MSTSPSIIDPSPSSLQILKKSGKVVKIKKKCKHCKNVHLARPAIIHLHHPCKFSHSGFVTSYDSQPQPSAMLWHSLLRSLQRKKRERHIAHVFYIASCSKHYILVSLPFSSTMILEAPQLILWKPWSSHPVIFGCFYLWMIDNNLWSDFCRDSSVTIL